MNNPKERCVKGAKRKRLGSNRSHRPVRNCHVDAGREQLGVYTPIYLELDCSCGYARPVSTLALMID